MSENNIVESESGKSNFIKEIIKEDLKNNKNDGRVATRFPPEPNGYLHIGHAKSICLNFGLAKEFNGTCNLRFDDTNPSKEETEYVDSIQDDVKWLGFDWEDRLFYASDYYEKLYDFAVKLIKKGKAYVCDLSADQMREYRGTLKQPGKESPFRNRTAEENLELFIKMRNGEFKDGEKTLRGKIDMSSGYIVMRDPVLYRIQRSTHHRTGDAWCIYPMYDFAHPLSDSIEGITHSVCTLEFENNRPLYDWVVNETEVMHKPRQIEFARLNLSYTVMSKRKLLELVTKNYVSGWDDPRMPTIAGIRRRGYTPEAIRDFADRIGVAKADNMVDIAMLEHCLREDLNKKAQRVMAILDPVKVIVDNYPDGKIEFVEAVNNPEDESMGRREMPFSKELWIERQDFMEVPPKGYFRLSPGAEVRFKHAYYIKCVSVEKDLAGNIETIHCTYDPETRGGWSQDGRKIKGTIHWVSAAQALICEARLYEHLFTKENPDDLGEGEDYKANLNRDSLKVITKIFVEPFVKDFSAGDKFQFDRTGYFCIDSDSTKDKLVFNRTVSLKDSWGKTAGKNS
ncbi:MAG TPA: glutamine--tRNA ligase/YqeY domain fusion protein [Spirochaetota bacterium]|nr:glutamine--tRNA ligase/YqeY domain fusion protein [Spirochaetota bacterium]HPS85644.1 glutamine--tRNA ligase/YqeY domain fusion protein [Spirochaetota bacterium]